MSSRTQVQPIGYRTRLIGAGPSLAGALGAHSQAVADNRWAIYVADLGNGRHLVRNDCNDQPYEVGSAVNATLRKDDAVLLGSNTGTGGEVIIAGPDLSRFGAGGSAQEISYRTIARDIVAPSTCPSALRGRSYLAIIPYLDGFRAARYSDTTYQADIGIPWGVGDPIGSPAWPQRYGADRFIAGSSGMALFYSIDPFAGTVATATMTWASSIGPPILSGGFVYWVAYPNDLDPATSLQLYKAPVGFDGDVDEPSARVGAAFAPSGLAAQRGLCSLGGGAFLLPATISGVPKLLSFAGGAWTARSVPVLAESDGAPGFQVFGGAFRLTNRPLIDSLAGEFYLFPDVPAWTGFHSTSYSVFSSVSPGRGEMSVYPVDDGEGDFRLLRIAVQAVGASCPPPFQVVAASPHGQPTHMIPRDH